MRNRKLTNNLKGVEWYECGRCGMNFPRSDVIVQGGTVVCRGPNTTGCFDLPGHDYYVARTPIPVEENPPPLPVDETEV
jgi:hypothetical protein